MPATQETWSDSWLILCRHTSYANQHCGETVQYSVPPYCKTARNQENRRIKLITKGSPVQQKSNRQTLIHSTGHLSQPCRETAQYHSRPCQNKQTNKTTKVGHERFSSSEDGRWTDRHSRILSHQQSRLFKYQHVCMIKQRTKFGMKACVSSEDM